MGCGLVACPLVLWLCLGYVGIDALCRCRLWVVAEGFVCARRAAPAADHPLGPVSCACVPAVPVWDVCSVRRRPAGISESRLTFPVKQPPLRGLR